MSQLQNNVLPYEGADDVEAHLVKEAIAAGVVAGAMFAGTAQAKASDRAPSAPLAAARVQRGTAAVVFDGGTMLERSQVTRALAASSFDWSRLPPVTVHIGSGYDDQAMRGEIWIDSALLNAGKFSWGVVQHEYAHEVDFFLLDDDDRAQLLNVLGGTTWCEDDLPGLRHSAYGCERFASTLAWAYWQSSANCMKPQGRSDLESGSVSPAVFRATLQQMLDS
jgi:hypothetical protein